MARYLGAEPSAGMARIAILRLVDAELRPPLVGQRFKGN